MTSDEVRVYLTEAIARGLAAADGIRSTETMFEERWAEYLRRAEAVLAVVETLRTPCPECGDGLVFVGDHDNELPFQCERCGGTGQSALLAFDEMRGMKRCAAGLYMGGRHVDQPVYWFPAVLLSPDTTETP